MRKGAPKRVGHPYLSVLYRRINVLRGSDPVLPVNPAVYRKLPYDTLRDFAPIIHIANSTGLVIVVHPSFPARSLQELIETARASPGKIIYCSAGFGNLTHIDRQDGRRPAAVMGKA